MRQLRVLFLQPQPCIRALKYAIGLKRLLGNELEISFGYTKHNLNQIYGYGSEYF